MAGRGPAPKPADKRAGHARTAKANQLRPVTVEFVPAVQPALPDSVDWPAETRTWWKNWAESPLACTFMATDWDFLLESALLHAKVWQGHLSHLQELRLRVAKFGATPEDRARLRIQFADATVRESRARRREAIDQTRQTRRAFIPPSGS